MTASSRRLLQLHNFLILVLPRLAVSPSVSQSVSKSNNNFAVRKEEMQQQLRLVIVARTSTQRLGLKTEVAAPQGNSLECWNLLIACCVCECVNVHSYWTVCKLANTHTHRDKLLYWVVLALFDCFSLFLLLNLSFFLFFCMFWGFRDFEIFAFARISTSESTTGCYWGSCCCCCCCWGRRHHLPGGWGRHRHPNLVATHSQLPIILPVCVCVVCFMPCFACFLISLRPCLLAFFCFLVSLRVHLPHSSRQENAYATSIAHK